MEVKVYNQDGKEVGTTVLAPDLFEVEPNEAVVHQYIVNLLARQRQGNAATKTRNAVRGGGRKPWRQKGTGRARAGTIRSPLWRGGGTVHGPQPRSYGSRFPRRMKRLAIASVLSSKAKAEEIKVVDKLELAEFKTKAMQDILGKLEVAGRKTLILDDGRNEKLYYSVRNLPRVNYALAQMANGYDLMNHDVVLFTQAGLQKAQEVFGS